MPHSLQNIHNLIDLWTAYGGQQATSQDDFNFYRCQQWPHRHWFEFPSPIESSELLPQLIKQALDQSKPDAILPVWQIPDIPHSAKTQQLILEVLKENAWIESFKQTAMYIPSHELSADMAKQSTLKLTKVTTPEDVTIWCDIGARAFNYEIDLSVINQLIQQDNCHLYLAWHHDTVVASGMLFKTGKVIGLHQMSVDPHFQGQGFAKMFMYNLLQNALTLGGATITLQASPAGYPLYKKLGFIDLFDIVSYKRSSNF